MDVWSMNIYGMDSMKVVGTLALGAKLPTICV